jgi:voltage-gated potassium channel
VQDLKTFEEKLDRASYTLIITCVAAIIVESHSLSTTQIRLLEAFNIVAYVFFSFEYVLRLILASRQGTLRSYVFSFFGLIDLLAIAPFFLPLVVAVDTRVLRLVRLLRFVNVLKLGRHSKAIENLVAVFKAVRYEISITFFTSALVIVLSGILMFYAEHEAQPAVFTNMSQSIWWAVSTLTTVGYGDIYPITPIGKLLAATLAFVGIGLVAIPAGLVSAAYIDFIKQNKK